MSDGALCVWRRLLADFCARPNSLDGYIRLGLIRHLRECPSCRERLEVRCDRARTVLALLGEVRQDGT